MCAGGTTCLEAPSCSHHGRGPMGRAISGARDAHGRGTGVTRHEACSARAELYTVAVVLLVRDRDGVSMRAGRSGGAYLSGSPTGCVPVWLSGYRPVWSVNCKTRLIFFFESAPCDRLLYQVLLRFFTRTRHRASRSHQPLCECVPERRARLGNDRRQHMDDMAIGRQC